jgi:hypothetical protein
MRKSGKLDFRCQPRLFYRQAMKTWMPATSAGMTMVRQTVQMKRV